MSTEALPAATDPKPVEETPYEWVASNCVLVICWLFVTTFLFQNFEIPSASMQNTLLIGDHVIVDRDSLAPSTRWAPFVHYRPVQRGDIIVFLKPHSESPDMILVKRAIGIPGDHIHLRGGTVYLNGIPQLESYTLPPTEATYIPYRDEFPSDLADERAEALDDFSARGDCKALDTPADVAACTSQQAIDKRTLAWVSEMPRYIQGEDLVVPPGMVFAMGDNRTESLDGRFWGFVPEENIMGRPLFVYWSFKTPADQEDKISAGDRIGFMFHVLIHIFDGTRWSRTFHITR